MRWIRACGQNKKGMLELARHLRGDITDAMIAKRTKRGMLLPTLAKLAEGSQ